MFSAMKRSRATAGGQRDSPMFASPGGVTRASYAGRVEANRSERWLELVSTVLLALATVATAWAAYQSRQWTGELAQGYSHATATRIAENRSAALANRQVQIDVATFIQWIDAHAHQDEALADFYRATKPFTSPQAPPTPFAMPRYRLRASAEAQKLESDAAADSDHAKSANENADNYMLAVVLFASSLFFAGISTKMRSVRAQAGLLGLGCVLFLGTLIWALTLPVHLAT